MDQNPYQSITENIVEEQEDPDNLPWRDGSVALGESPLYLPDVCVKCGTTTDLEREKLVLPPDLVKSQSMFQVVMGQELSLSCTRCPRCRTNRWKYVLWCVLAIAMAALIFAVWSRDAGVWSRSTALKCGLTAAVAAFVSAVGLLAASRTGLRVTLEEGCLFLLHGLPENLLELLPPKDG